MPRALLSVSDKTGLADFARGLAARGFELVSTGGTAKALQQAGLTVIAISEVTGFPEMMDGRVKTLHPLVHGGILARRARPDDLASAATHGITLIDLVVVNLYPFVKAASNPDTPFEGLELIEKGDTITIRTKPQNPTEKVQDEAKEGGGPKMDADTEKMMKDAFSKMRVTYRITAPFKIVSHNATRQEGQTLIWEYNFAKFEEMSKKKGNLDDMAVHVTYKR